MKDLTNEQQVCIKFCATIQTSCPGLSLVMRAGFTVTTLIQGNNPPNGKIQGHQAQKNVRQMNTLIVFFDIKGMIKKGFILAGQTVNSACCVRMCKNFASNFGDKRTGCRITKTYHLTLPFILEIRNTCVKTFASIET
jgi:hypothetical protein